MGTSTARRPPATALWRAARGAARRYLAPEGAQGVPVREVVAHYLAALAESEPEGHGLKEGLPLTRKVAQNLGAFWAQTNTQGLEAALGTWGLAGLADAPPGVIAAGLAAACPGAEGSLEAAAARTALHALLPDLWSPAGPPAANSFPPSPSRVVGRYLAVTLYQRLALDLGESLEAAAPDGNRLQGALDGLRAYLDQAAATDDVHLTPELWRGLDGWLQVGRLWEDLLQRLQG